MKRGDVVTVAAVGDYGKRSQIKADKLVTMLGLSRALAFVMGIG